MATQVKTNSEQLLQAIGLFEQTWGSCESELELQATLAALVAVMGIKGHALIRSIAKIYTQQGQPTGTDPSLELRATVQSAKERLTTAEKTLISFVRTYLQRISSKLSAQEFTEMVQAAVVLLDEEQSGKTLSLPERKYLLCNALESFGTQLSQPIPTMGERVDKPIKRLIKRLVRYRRLSRVEDLTAVVNTITKQLSRCPSQALSPKLILVQLAQSELVEVADRETLAELAEILCFQLQLNATEIDPKVKGQVSQAIANFQTQYRPWVNVAQPVWDGELSVSSSLFRAKASIPK